MVKIIVAFSSDEKCARYASVLEAAGLRVFRKCTSAGEVKRALNQCGDGVIITSSALNDDTADALTWDVGDRADILALGRASQLELCEHPHLLRLIAPFSKAELISAVNELLRQHIARLPRRTDHENRLILDAKALLMRLYCVSEPEAHRRLQKGAMDRGLKMSDFAAKLLESWR